MSHLLEAGPFSARDGEGRTLFEDAVVRLAEDRLTLLEGVSGSGKSSLMRLLTAVDRAPAARRSLAGRRLEERAAVEWRSQVVLLAQDAPMLPGAVIDNLRFPFRLEVAAGRAFSDARATELMRAVGLEALPPGRDAATLSGGERHRLALVRGLLWDPPVLVADEPLSGLDPEAAKACFSLLLAHARRPGHAVLCALHDPALAATVDAVLRLGDGVLREGRWAS